MFCINDIFVRGNCSSVNAFMNTKLEQTTLCTCTEKPQSVTLLPVDQNCSVRYQIKLTGVGNCVRNYKTYIKVIA